MAVDPKTGKPGFEHTWRGIFALDHDIRESVRRMLAAEGTSSPPPDAGPRGVSPLRGAYGPWLAAHEWVKAEAERQP